MSLLIKYLRIDGFRGLNNFEIELEHTTVLTGMNNAGKTSLLKALQLAIGSRQFIAREDFSILDGQASTRITIDILIVPVDQDGNELDDFADEWETDFTIERIEQIDGVKAVVPLRTEITYNEVVGKFSTKQFILAGWPNFEDWLDQAPVKEKSFIYDNLPFFYIDAQRDILEDIKLRNSYLGKMVSQIKYSQQAVDELEEQIKALNDKAIDESAVLSNIKEALRSLDTAMGAASAGVEITPFTKRVRDLNKGLTIYYADNRDSFSMEYHGMGTRSWSALLTLKAFVIMLSKSFEDIGDRLFFPIIAVEEPEAHLHPNAQKKLFSQINAFSGQKIISTHSPYVAAAAELKQIRSLYKSGTTKTGKVDVSALEDEDLRKINRQVVNTRGEIFFSKVLVFFEGETEEQALPILAEKYFQISPVELGVDFLGVGGYGNYRAFIRFAEALHIPWVILSDADKVEIIENVRAQVAENSTKNEADCLKFLDSGNDFERQLITDGYQEEIKEAIISLENFRSDQHAEAKKAEISVYTDEVLYQKISGEKTKFGPVIATKIIESQKAVPPFISQVFDIVSGILNTGNNRNEY